MPQEIAIYPDLTATENLRFFGRLYDMPSETLDKRVEEVLEVIGLSERQDDLVSEFSGGMQRRLNIGIGLLHRPRLLILDEPTVGVDPQSRNAILESVEDLSGEGIAVLYTTHYMEEAERLCDRVAIIDEGVIKAEGTRRELVSLVGEKDRIRVTVTGDLVEVARVACPSCRRSMRPALPTRAWTSWPTTPRRFSPSCSPGWLRPAPTSLVWRCRSPISRPSSCI